MAGRARGKKNVSQKLQKDAVTQTSPEKHTFELDHLRDQVNLLCEELRLIKQNQQQFNEPVITKQKDERTVLAVADSPQQQIIPPKGCSCRGKCASRACGCVKKQMSCTAACKCQHKSCKNQDHDKENIDGKNTQAEVSEKVQRNAKLSAALKLRENIEEKEEDTKGATGPSKKQPKLSKKSLFSPDSTKTRRHEVSVSQLQVNSPIKFGSSKKTVHFDSRSSREVETQIKLADSEKSRFTDPDSLPEEKKPMKKQRKKAVNNRLEVPAETTGQSKSNSDEGKKKRVISVHSEARKIRGAASPYLEDIQDERKNKPVKENGKAKNTGRVLTETAANSVANLDLPVRRSLDEELEQEAIDPMKPTRQLQRTPVSASPRTNWSGISESSPPKKEPVEAERRSVPPPPDGIDTPVVNWEEHCAQLVPCRFCTRTFYPFRLEKHEASCQRI